VILVMFFVSAGKINNQNNLWQNGQNMISRLFGAIIRWFDCLIFGEVICVGCKHCSFRIPAYEDDDIGDILEKLQKHYCFSQPNVREDQEFVMWSRRFLFFYQEHSLVAPTVTEKTNKK